MSISLTDAAERILRKHSPGAPMHYRKITELAVAEQLIIPGGPTPEASLNASVNMEIGRRKRGGRAQRFRAQGKGLYGLALPSDPLGGGVDAHNRVVRQRLRALLGEMDPKEFESLIGRLLTSIGFDNVEVTQYHGDKGVDLRADLTVGGVTNVRTAIQVKRWSNNVQAPQVRELRGGLGPHERGLIISTGGFSSGAKDEAEEPNRSPISMIGGDELIDLFVVNEIGVAIRTVEILELDEEGLSALEDDATGGPSAADTSKFKSVWPLPGGADAMKSTLDTMLAYVSSSGPTLQEAIEWMIESHDKVGSQKTARSYWTVPRSFGMTEMDGERLSLTAEGAAYLEHPTEGELLRSMSVNLAGIGEILERLADGVATTDELLHHLNESIGVSWETDAQVKWRAQWLVLAGAVRPVGTAWALAENGA